MNKYLSDYLPSAMVRDLRRSMRSRGYFIFLLLALLVAVCVMLGSTATADNNSGVYLILIGIAVMWFIVPNRAAGAVSADAKVKGTNFMMLTPMGSRRIVWSICFSAVSQLLAIAAVGCLFVLWRHAVNPELPVAEEWMLYGIMVGIGVLMCAVGIFLAQLNRFFQVAFLVLVLFNLVSWVVNNIFLFILEDDPLGYLLQKTPPMIWWVLLAEAVLMMCTLLEFARRCYASPAENCSRTVRLAVPAVVLSVPGVYYLMPTAVEAVNQFASFAFTYAAFCCLSDAVLPTYSLQAHNRRAWPVLPAYLQVPGIGQASLYLVLMAALCWGVDSLWLEPASAGAVSVFGAVSGNSDSLLQSAAGMADSTYFLLVGLLLADLICARSSVNRPVVCAAMFVALIMLASMSMLMLQNTGAEGLLLLIPAASCDDLSPALSLVCSLVMCAFTLVCLMFRGRKSY